MSKFLAYARAFEPARLRAAYAAAVVLVGTLGLTVPTGLDTKAKAVLAFLAILIPVIQGEFTRAAVKPAQAPAQTDNSPTPSDGPQVESQDPSIVVSDDDSVDDVA